MLLPVSWTESPIVRHIESKTSDKESKHLNKENLLTASFLKRMSVLPEGSISLFFFIQIISKKDTSAAINVTIEGVNFRNCGTQDMTLLGGAIYIDKFQHPGSVPVHVVRIINSSFTNCQASYGAAVYRDNSLSASQTRLFIGCGPHGGPNNDLPLHILFTGVHVNGSGASSQGVFYLSDSFVRLEKRYERSKVVRGWWRALENQSFMRKEIKWVGQDLKKYIYQRRPAMPVRIKPREIMSFVQMVIKHLHQKRCKYW